MEMLPDTVMGSTHACLSHEDPAWLSMQAVSDANRMIALTVLIIFSSPRSVLTCV